MIEKPIKILLFLVGTILVIGSLNIGITYDQTTGDGIDDYYYLGEVNEFHLFIGFVILFCSIWVNEILRWIDSKLKVK